MKLLTFHGGWRITGAWKNDFNFARDVKSRWCGGCDDDDVDDAAAADDDGELNTFCTLSYVCHYLL